jgi:hypothetical protein
MNDIFKFREGLGKVFNINDYPVKGRLYLKSDNKIVLKALVQLMTDGNFYYTTNKFPKEIFNNDKMTEDIKTIHIGTNDIPLFFSWEFIPLNLDYDMLKGEKGKINPDFSFSLIDTNSYGTFSPLLSNEKLCTAEIY